MKNGHIERILIVGAGTMGQQISLQCAAHGYEVVLYDNDQTALDILKDNIQGHIDDLIRLGHLERNQAGDF